NAGGGGSNLGGSAGGGGASAPTCPCTACNGDPALEVSSASEADYQGNRIAWSDAAGHRRSALMVDNRIKDPAGFWGGYMRRFNYVANGEERQCVGKRSSHPGFGMVVNHYGNTSM